MLSHESPGAAQILQHYANHDATFPHISEQTLKMHLYIQPIQVYDQAMQCMENQQQKNVNDNFGILTGLYIQISIGR